MLLPSPFICQRQDSTAFLVFTLAAHRDREPIGNLAMHDVVDCTLVSLPVSLEILRTYNDA